MDSYEDDARSFDAIFGWFGLFWCNCEVWMAKCDEFYPMEKVLTGLKCPWSGQMRLVCLQAFGMVKFILFLAGLARCDVCTYRPFVRSNLMLHRVVEHERFFSFFTLRMFSK